MGVVKEKVIREEGCGCRFLYDGTFSVTKNSLVLRSTD